MSIRVFRSSKGKYSKGGNESRDYRIMWLVGGVVLLQVERRIIVE